MLIWKRWYGEADHMPPLHWTSLIGEGAELRDQADVSGARTVAILSCKHGHACGLRIGGASRFTVSIDGVIYPSVQCPVTVDGKVCDGHEGPPSQLEAWSSAWG